MPVHEKKQPHRLVLNRETIRSLSPSGTGMVMDGVISSCMQPCAPSEEVVTY